MQSLWQYSTLVPKLSENEVWQTLCLTLVPLFVKVQTVLWECCLHLLPQFDYLHENMLFHCFWLASSSPPYCGALEERLTCAMKALVSDLSFS